MIRIVHGKLLSLCLVLMAALSLSATVFAQTTPTMITLTSVQIGATQVVLNTDSPALSFDSYTLGAPPRLVVDVNNAIPEFKERSFAIPSGYQSLRVGLYADKTRFVLDAVNEVLPQVAITQKGSSLIIDWGTSVATVAEAAPVKAGNPQTVERLDFVADGGFSEFTVELSGATQLIKPVVDGDIVRFGIKNAVIPRSLRRVVDASVFPSAVLQITPYSTIVAGERNVMFAAHMKGPVDYSVNLHASKLVFRVNDGAFAEAAAEKTASVVIPVDVGAEYGQTIDGAAYAGDQVAQVIESLSGASSDMSTSAPLSGIGAEPEMVKIYTGEPVTLVFDDADIRKVMQLIAEISELNLILSEEVKGNISLRLIDVPWDQALDLVLEIKELGTITQGNVVRVLPLKKIQGMEEERLKAKITIKKLEETRTEIFEINYKDTDTIEDIIDDILSDQGEVSAIDGSKKIMVNDIPSKLEEIRALLAILDEPVKQVMIEARIVEANTSTGLDLGVNWGFGYNNDAAGGLTTPTGGVGIDGVDSADLGLGGSFMLPAALGTSGLGAALTFGRLGFDSMVLDLKISALEASGRGRVISSPKVMTLDGEPAKISQGTAIPYQSVSDQGTTTEFEDATLSLEVTPEVNPDGTVILQIKAANSTIGSTVSTGAGSAPSIDTKEAETKLMLKDGETTVIGGIYVDNTLESNTGTPFLKDIPYLGKLFQSNSKSNSRSELLIFITPHIIHQ